MGLGPCKAVPQRPLTGQVLLPAQMDNIWQLLLTLALSILLSRRYIVPIGSVHS
jgi:hypothetical protein